MVMKMMMMMKCVVWGTIVDGVLSEVVVVVLVVS